MKLTTKKLCAAMLSLSVLSLLALPMVAGAQDFGLNEAEGWGLGNVSLQDMIKGVVQIILGFLGIIAVLIILWGGFIWMTAAGDPDKVDKAKKMIYSGIIGLVIIFAAYAIASFVVNSLANTTGATGQ